MNVRLTSRAESFGQGDVPIATTAMGSALGTFWLLARGFLDDELFLS